MRNGFIGIAAFFLVATTPVFAQSQLELTLDAYVAVLRAEGATVEFSDRVTGGDGSVEFREFKITAPDDEFILNAEWVRFAPQPLQPEMTLVTFAPRVQATLKPDDIDEPVDLSLSSDDLKVLTNAIVVDPETLEKVDFRMSAGSLALVTADAGAGAPVTVNFVQKGMDLSFLVDHLAGRVTGAYNSANFDIDYSFDIDGAQTAAKSSVADLAADFFFDLPNEDEPETYFSEGKEFSFAMTAGPSTSAGNSSQDGMTVVFDSASQGSQALLEHIDGGLTYTASGDALEVGLKFGDALPPMSFSFGKMLFDLAMPTRSAETASDVRFGIVFSDIVADEGVWSMIDPAGSIPRDPALIDIRLVAKLRLNERIEEVFSPTGAVATGSIAPTEIANVESLDIDAFKVAVGGASVTADGALEFDNAGPIPMPLGDIQVIVNGLQGLSTKLVELGLLDQMQAGMAMGMVMGFARPGDEPDQFISDITFTESGILANGMPIQP